MREVRQFRQLVPLFFGRFFDNDLAGLDSDNRPALAAVLGLLIMPGLALPLLSVQKFSSMMFKPLWMRDIAGLQEKSFFLALSMAVLGIVAILNWDALFPDRRDYLVLRPLPIRLTTMFAAKLAALGLFWCIFTVATNGVSSVFFPFVLVARGSLAELLGTIRAHVISIVLANAFMLVAVLAIEGVLINVLGPRLFERIAPWVQFALVAVVLMGFFFSGMLLAGVQPDAEPSPVLLLFPPAWFLGLYQTLLGWHNPIFMELAHRAWTALGYGAALAAVAWLLSYARQSRAALQTVEGIVSAPGVFARTAIGLLDRFVLRTPAERASFHFIRQTLARSRKHRMLIAAWVGLAGAIIFEVIAGSIAQGDHTWWENIYGVLLIVPPVASLLPLVGMRHMFSVPSELRANWIFQVSQAGNFLSARRGVRKAVIVMGVLPWLLPVAAVHLLIWPFENALAHIAVSLAASILVVEMLFGDFSKLPFTCSYRPGKANLKMLWPLYLFGFMGWVWLVSNVEVLLYSDSRRIVLLALVIAAIVAAIRLARKRMAIGGGEPVFEEDPDYAVCTLQIDT